MQWLEIGILFGKALRERQCPLEGEAWCETVVGSVHSEGVYNMSALYFHVLDLTAILAKSLVGIVFFPILAHHWGIYVFTTQGLVAIFFAACRLALGGAL